MINFKLKNSDVIMIDIAIKFLGTLKCKRKISSSKQ